MRGIHVAIEHLRGIVYVVKFGHRRVAVLQHLYIELARNRVRLFGREPLHELIHELAPGPEVVVRRRAYFGEARHRALEGMRMQVRHARQHRTRHPLGAGGPAIRFHGHDVAALDADAHVARPAGRQQCVARVVLRHVAIIARCMTASG